MVLGVPILKHFRVYVYKKKIQETSHFNVLKKKKNVSSMQNKTIEDCLRMLLHQHWYIIVSQLKEV